jgi:DNA-binding SARP family transcriptional activator/tetratricopeptide (TPR) repeat protein
MLDVRQDAPPGVHLAVGGLSAVGEIRTAYPLIQNKVTSPHYVTPTLRRARLIEWLNHHASCRAVVVAAEAGYGKTTLLWQWEREVGFPCYWYKLDRNDRDWSLHVSYLIEAIAQRHPGFGHRAHSMLLQLGGPGSSRPGVAAFLLAEMQERLTEPCTFIIDDWQFVARQTEVRGLWNQILRDAPSTCRFIFLSRAKPQLQFARFRTHGGYGELRTDALRFTEAEIDALFRDIYADPLEATELAELDHRTEGWAASLQLVEVSLREKPSPVERRAFIQSITASSDSDLFAFLAEEVLDQQIEETRNFLLCTSILQQITPELAERMTGVRDGSQLLAELEQRGLFTNRLGDAEERYRYHGLFRDFLERRLIAERTDAEVVGLHIHAASYYETTLQWPQAIHHYLRAGLQRQAARLIAKYGEEVVAEGRLGLIDEWLDQLPPKAIRDNARLSLLHGEALGTIRGEWDAALGALERGLAFFTRKRDSRMSALAELKLSTHYLYRGDISRSLEAADRGLRDSPADDYETRLRLRGNLSITATWLESLERTERDCEALVAEAKSRGLLHYAAIGHHNLGLVQRSLGRITESLANFEEADRFWGGIPSSPFGDNADFVQALLAAGQVANAELKAIQGELRTRSWPRPNAEAAYGRAHVLVQRGEFAAALRVLRKLLAKREILGGLEEVVLVLFIQTLHLAADTSDDIEWAAELLGKAGRDPRLSAESATAVALAAHAKGRCAGECERAAQELSIWENKGARFDAACGYVQLAPLRMEHGNIARTKPLQALSAAERFGAFEYLRWWLRPYAKSAHLLMRDQGGVSQLLRVAAADLQYWLPYLVKSLPSLTETDRKDLLTLLMSNPSANVAAALSEIAGTDIAEARSAILRTTAERLYIRAFGPLTIHRGHWDGEQVRVDKKRLRLLLGLLVANRHRTLSRDVALESLWPDHDPAGGVNNLNQAVFQLRRHLDAGSRDPDRPQYVVSNLDAIALDGELVITDLEEVRRLAGRLEGATTGSDRQTAAVAMLALIRGEFLADLRYEDWTAGIQQSVAAEVRGPLLQIAMASAPEIPPHVSLRAAEVLTEFDPFDESAQVAMARKLYEMGRRAAARQLLAHFATSVEEELQAPASQEVQEALADLAGLPPTRVQ